VPAYTVALVIGQLEGGGAEKHCWWLARAFRRLAIPVEVIGIEARPATRARYAELGVPLTLIDGEEIPRRLPAWHPARPFRFARRFVTLRQALARRQPYLVHSFLPYANILVATMRPRTGVSVHVAGHRYAGRAGRLYNASQSAQTLLRSASELHLANSAEVGRFLVEELKIPAGRVAVAVNGIAAEETQVCTGARGPVRRELGLADEDVALGMVCNLWPYKGIDTFQEAFSIARRVHPRLRGFVAGRDVGTLARLEEHSRRLGIAEAFTFLGERSDVCRLLRGFDVLVSASRGEGMSNSVLEAMAHALPVVGSRAAGTAELLDDGRAGLLFEAGDAATSARHLIFLAGSPSERARLGAAAAERAATRFSLDRTVEETLRAYASASRADPAAAEYFTRAADAVAGGSSAAVVADRGGAANRRPSA
jgi:glycosyltransferase involved in cell wall biosynthesis